MAHAILSIEAWQINCTDLSNPRKLKWDVVFPAGFHDMLHVKFQEFTKEKWEKLVAFKAWVSFRNGLQQMDWEFCLDDMEVSFTKRATDDADLCDQEDPHHSDPY